MVSHDEVVHVHAADIRANATISKINCHDRYDQIFFGFMNVQLVHLHTLQSVARHGSFSRAARELRLTQPAVSMQVRQLERELGLPLLERVGKRTYTTKAGELLLAHAGRAMQELDRGLELIQEPGASWPAGSGSARAPRSASTCCRRRCAGSAPAIRARSSSSSPATRRRSPGRWWRTSWTSAS